MEGSGGGGQCLYCVWEQVGERHKNPLRERSPHPARLAKGGKRKRAGQGHPEWRNNEMAGRLADPRRREASKPGLCAPTSELAKLAAKGGSSLFLINRNPSNDIRRAHWCQKGGSIKNPTTNKWPEAALLLSVRSETPSPIQSRQAAWTGEAPLHLRGHQQTPVGTRLKNKQTKWQDRGSKN